MKTVKIVDFKAFYSHAIAYLNSFPNERSVLTYALQKLTSKYKKQALKLDEETTSKISDTDAKYCLKDKETGAFLEREYEIGGQLVYKKQFDQVGESAKKKDIDDFIKAQNEREIEFEPHFVQIPSNIDISWVRPFTDFVFEPMSEEQEQEWYLSQYKKSEKKE